MSFRYKNGTTFPLHDAKWYVDTAKFLFWLYLASTLGQVFFLDGSWARAGLTLAIAGLVIGGLLLKAWWIRRRPRTFKRARREVLFGVIIACVWTGIIAALTIVAGLDHKWWDVVWNFALVALGIWFLSSRLPLLKYINQSQADDDAIVEFGHESTSTG